MDDLLNLEHLFYDEQYFPKEDQELLIINSKCEHNYVQMQECWSCCLCGVVDIDRPVFLDSRQESQKSCYLYTRKTYFLTVLRLLSGLKQCESDKYPEVIKKISEHEFNNIFELKKIMSKLKMQKYYKFIYSIYFDIKKIKLINLKYDDIEFLTNKFILLEFEFKKYYPNKSNMISYSLILYCLLKYFDYDCYKYIITPKKTEFLNEVTKILKNIEK